MSKKFGLAMILCIIIGGLFIACDGGNGGENNMNNDQYIQLPDNRIASYEEIDRQLVIENFEKLEIGMTYDEFVSLIGRPNGFVGSGFSFPYYELSDNTYIVIVMFGENPSKLFNLKHIDTEGNYTELFLYE